MNRTTTRRPRGFTLVELMSAVTIVGILSTIALPPIESSLQRMRRVDAQISLATAQLAQERWRTNAMAYAPSLAALGLAPQSMQRHYTLETGSVDALGYELTATATGAQQRDRDCRVLRLVVRLGQATQRSGPDASAANGDEANRRCWGK